MGFSSIWHWVILLLIVVLVFGTKKLTGSGKDVGNAVREFKKALHDDDGDKQASIRADADADANAADTTADKPAQNSQQSSDHSD